MHFLRIRTLSAMTWMTLLAACGGLRSLDSAHRVESAEQVGKVYVSAYPVVPWSEVGSKLEPKHNLSTADARAMAALTTQSQISQFLSTFSAGLGLGLPSKNWSSSTSTDNAGITTTTSASQRAAGVLPDSSGAIAAPLAHDTLTTDLGKAALTSGIDATTQLMGGSAVYQLAAILDNQLSKAWMPRGYQANLITFQVNLQPSRRDLPYDTYVNLALLPGDLSAGVTTSLTLTEDASTFPPVMVYPLVIADAMETSSVAKSMEIMRQAALSLSGIVNNIGLRAGLQGGTDRLDAIVAGDRNSLTTVGRVSDHAVRIRLGAQQQGTTRLAMVPKTVNISMVVFTRAAERANGYLDRLAVVSDVTFADVATGLDVPGTPRAVLQRAMDGGVRALMLQHDIRPVGINECGGPATLASNLVRAAERSEYQYLSRCLAIAPADTDSVYRTQLATTEDTAQAFTKQDYGTSARSTTYHRLCDYRGNGPCVVKARTPSTPTAPTSVIAESTVAQNHPEATTQQDQSPTMPAYIEADFRRFVAGLLKLRAASLEQRMLIALPFKAGKPVLPDAGQIALLADDQHTAKVELRGGASLRADKLEAKLCIGAQTPQRFLVPLAVTVAENGQTIQTSFTSLAKNALAQPGEAIFLRIHQTNLTPPVPDGCACPTSAAIPSLPMTIQPYDKVTTSATPGCIAYALTTMPASKPAPENPLKVTSAVLVADHAGNARLSVTAGITTGVQLRIGGAELRSTEPALTFDASANAYTLPTGMVVMLTLGNLAPGRNVSLIGINNGTVAGAPIMLPVQYGAHPSPP